MEDFNQVNDIIKEYRLKNKNQYNILDILDILEKEYDLGNNTSCSFYMSRQVYDEWCRWCKVHPSLTTADLTDRALIYAMMAIPNKNALIQIEIPEKTVMEKTLDDTLQEMIVTEDLTELILTLKKINGKLHISKKKAFLVIIKEYQKIKKPSNGMIELMKEAKSYFV